MRLIDADKLKREIDIAIVNMVEMYKKNGAGAFLSYRDIDINYEQVIDFIDDSPTVATIEIQKNKRILLYEWEIDNENPEYYPNKIKINKGILTAIQELKGRAD